MDEVWLKALADYLPTQATKARDAAAKWSESAVALLAIIGVTTIFKGRETLEAVAEPARSLLVLSVVLSLVASFWTLYAAARAAQGSTSAGWAAPNTFRQSQLASVDHTSRWMGYSQAGVIVAFAFSLAAVLLIWAGPKPASTPSVVMALGVDGSHPCGELKVEDGRLTVGGQTVPAPPVYFQKLDKCP